MSRASFTNLRSKHHAPHLAQYLTPGFVAPSGAAYRAAMAEAADQLKTFDAGRQHATFRQGLERPNAPARAPRLCTGPAVRGQPPEPCGVAIGHLPARTKRCPACAKLATARQVKQSQLRFRERRRAGATPGRATP